MTEKVIFYQPLSHVDEEWLKSSLLFVDEITAVKPLLISDFVYDRAISRYKLLSSDHIGIFNRDLMRSKNRQAKAMVYAAIQSLANSLGLREVESDQQEEKSVLLHELSDRNIIQPYRLTKDNTEVADFLSQLKKEIENKPDIEFVNGDDLPKASLLLNSNLRESLEDLIQLFPGEVPEEIFIPLDYNPDGKSSKFWEAKRWIKLKKPFLDYFFNSIAVRLSETHNLAVLTDTETNYNTSNTIRFKRKGYESTMAKGSMYEMLIENYQIDKSTPIDTIIKFKDKYDHELKKFRNDIADISKSIDLEERSSTMIERQIKEYYETKIMASLTDLERALKGQRMKFAKTLLMKIALISSSPSYLLSKINVPNKELLAPVTFFSTAGFFLAQSVIEYQSVKKEKVDTTKFNYLLKIKKRFGE